MVFRFTGLWRHPDFMKLWVGSTVSRFGSQITFLALPLTAVLVLDATPAQMGILMAMGTAPALVFGLGAGVWVDRRKKRPILIATDYGRAILLLAVPVLAVLGVLRMEYLYLIAMALGMLTLVFGVASRSMLPSLVTRDELVEANSKLAIGRSASEVVAPGIGGILVQLFTAPIALVVDAFTFVVSALAIQSMRAPEPEPDPAEGGDAFMREAWRGVDFVVRNRVLLAIAGVVGGIAVFNSMFEAVWLLYVSKDLGLGPVTFGIMFSVGSVGFMAGAVVAERLIAWLGIGRAIVIGVVVAGLSDLATPLVGGSVIAIVFVLTAASFVFGVGATIYGIAQESLQMAATPQSFQGRMHGVMNTLGMGLIPIGALIGGFLGETIGMRPTLFIAAGGELAAVLWLLLTPVWRMRELPSLADDASDS
ncbi:MAG: MFS transporter [Chloroflexi bacterium]|nr:MFS transporter [Chloroflexota bacterium]